jgi:hypothetical protein
MAKIKKLDWSELKTLGQPRHPIADHLKKYWPVYTQIIFTTGAFMLTSPHSALAATNIDASGTRIYQKIVNIGKWVIIIKGSIDIIQNITAGDTQSAKKQFLGYLMVYGTLFALPWGMDQVQSVFQGGM